MPRQASLKTRQQFTVVESTLAYCLTLILTVSFGCGWLLLNFLNGAQTDLGQEALKQKDTLEFAIQNLLQKTGPAKKSIHDFSAADFEKLQKQFRRQRLSGLLVLQSKSRILLSSFENNGLRAQQTLSLNDRDTTLRRLEAMGPEGLPSTLANGDLIWFFQTQFKVNDSPAPYYLGLPLRFRHLQARTKHLAWSLGLMIIALLGTFAALMIRLLKTEIKKPAAALAKVLHNTVAKSQLEELSALEQLKNSWQPHQRHEYALIFSSVEQFLTQLNHLNHQAKAMAEDRLAELHNEQLRFGGLAQEHLRLAEFLESVAAALDQLAVGNFEMNLEQKLRPDGSIGNSFHKMHSSIQFLIERLSLASHKLKTSARKLQDSSTTQANAATKQAAGVMMTMATMEELAASSGHIADTAKHVVKIAEQTLENASEGQAAVENVGEGMEEIVKASLKGAERLLNLDEKSRSIGRVATLIAGVSEQSKILALNAAIQAAHAGEAGRGFSVVAEEVRNLADSVFDSTREIEDLINEIQGEIRQAVQASEEEVRRANRGRDLATKAQETIASIYSSAKNMTMTAHQIELATNQQRSASGQVANAVRDMAASADDVAKGAKSVLASLDDLGHLADDLQQILAHFNAHRLTVQQQPTPETAAPTKAS